MKKEINNELLEELHDNLFGGFYSQTELSPCEIHEIINKAFERSNLR